MNRKIGDDDGDQGHNCENTVVLVRGKLHQIKEKLVRGQEMLFA